MAINPGGIGIRPADAGDLDALNRVIEAAVMSWELPERVKRLSLPLYRYTRHDLAHLGMVVAEDRRQQLVGIAAWEKADSRESPDARPALLLHGIYVDPAYHRQGIGRRLFIVAEEVACRLGYSGLLVRAQPDAMGFFTSCGMRKLAVDAPACQYAHRFWVELTTPSLAD